MNERTGACDRTILYSVLLLIGLLPLAIGNFTALGAPMPATANSTAVPKLFALGALTGAGLLAWTLRALAADAPIRVPRRWLIPTAFLVLVMVSTVTAIAPATAVLGSNEYYQGAVAVVLLLVAFALTVETANSAARVRVLTVTAVASSALVAAYGALQMAGLDPNTWPGAEPWHLARGSSTIGNPDMFAGFLLFGIMTAAALALAENDTYRKAAGWALCLAIAGVATLTLVRAAWIGMIVGALVLALFARTLGVRPHRVDWSFIAATPAVAFVVAVVGNLTSEGLLVRRFIEALTNPVEASTGRVELWRETFAMITERPLFGTGPDSFALGWYAHQSPETVRIAGFAPVAHDAHNSALMLAATLGVPAALAFTVWVISTLLDASSSVRTAAGHPTPSRVLYVGWTAALAAYLAYSLLGVTTMASALMLAVTLGILSAPAALSFSARMPVRRAAAIGAGTLGLAGVVFCGAVLFADVASQRGITSTDGVTAGTHAERATELMPLSFDYHRRLVEIETRLALQRLDASNTPPTAALARADRLVLDFPAHYDGYVVYAGFLNRLSQRLGPEYSRQAAEVAAQGYRVRPNGLAARMLAAIAYEALGDDAAIAAVLSEWWDVDPRQVEPGVRYGHALLGLGKTDEAIAVAEYLSVHFPDDERVAQLLEDVGSAAGSAP